MTEKVHFTTETSSETWHIESPCTNRMIDTDDPLNDEPCQMEHWIRTDGLPTGFLTCERHLGSAGYISWPQP